MSLLFALVLSTNVLANQQSNEFPPMFGKMITDLMQKDELNIFVPDDSDFYLYLNMINDRKNGINKTKSYSILYSNYPQEKYIKKIEPVEHGYNVIINLKDSPLTDLYIRSESLYSMRYTYGRGQVLNMRLITSVELENYRYLEKKYSDMLTSKGFEPVEQSFATKLSEYFALSRNPEFSQNDVVVAIQWPSEEDQRFLPIGRTSIVLVIYNKNYSDPKDYNKLVESIKSKDLDEKYDRIDKIFK